MLCYLKVDCFLVRLCKAGFYALEYADNTVVEIGGICEAITMNGLQIELAD